MASDSTLHALIGAVLTVVLSFVPFVSPVLGGGVATYLSGADANEGVRIGAVSGVIASVPIIGLGLIAFFFVGIFALGAGNGVAFGIGGLIIVLLFGAVAVAYTVGLSALGGYLASYVVEGG